MPNVVQTLRSITPGQRPAGRAEGELYVNLPDKQFGMVDDTGAPVDLGAVRHWSALAAYAIGDLVAYGGHVYSCLAAHQPIAIFRTQNWALYRAILNADIDTFVETTGDDANDGLSVATAWATLDRAFAYFEKIDLNYKSAEIRLGVGTFTHTSGYVYVNGGRLYVTGKGVDQTIVNLNTTIWTRGGGHYSRLYLAAMTIKAPANDNLIYSMEDILIQIEGVALDLTAASPAWPTFQISNGELLAVNAIEVRQAGIVSGHAFIYLHSNAEYNDNAQWTLTGTPNVYRAWVEAIYFSTIKLINATVFTGVGAGPPYILQRGSLFNTSGKILPGDQLGHCDPTSYIDGVRGTDPYVDAPGLVRREDKEENNGK